MIKLVFNFHILKHNTTTFMVPILKFVVAISNSITRDQKRNKELKKSLLIEKWKKFLAFYML